MIAVSSFRPFADCTPEIILNQCRANDSWQQYFDRIIYFGPYEPELAGEKVFWFPYAGQPSIKQMCYQASFQNDWACLINADIVIGPRWPDVERQLKESGLRMAMSKRWQFDVTDEGPRNLKVDDLGLDFFATVPDVWRFVAGQCPDAFKLGCIQWDTWMLGMLYGATAGRGADLTPSRVVQHPRHGSRKDQSVQPVPQHLFPVVRWPQVKIQ